MKITVIIPTHNRKTFLVELLTKLNQQTNDGAFDLAIVVVDDGSTDGTESILKELFPNVAVVKGDGAWYYTKCLNEGWKRAISLNSDLLLTMNDDCSIKSDLVFKLFDAYRTLPERSAVGAITIVNSNPFRITFSGSRQFNKLKVKFVPYLDNRLEVNPEELSGIYPTYSLMTRGLLFPANSYELTGFFDENRFPQYGSDEDFALRLINAGFGCYVSWDVQIIDYPLLTSKGSAITRPPFKKFIRTFFDPYSINSISKTIKFQQRHGYRLLLPIHLVWFIVGTFYASFWKYRKTNLTG